MSNSTDHPFHAPSNLFTPKRQSDQKLHGTPSSHFFNSNVRLNATRVSKVHVRSSSLKSFVVPLKLELSKKPFDTPYFFSCGKYNSACSAPVCLPKSLRFRTFSANLIMLHHTSPLHHASMIVTPPVLSATTQSATTIRLSLVTPTTIPICHVTTTNVEEALSLEESTVFQNVSEESTRRRRSLSTPNSETTTPDPNSTPRRSISTNVMFCLSPHIILHIDHLPNSLLERIFSYLSCEDLWCNVRLVCRRWRDVASSPIFWRHLNLKKQTSLHWALQRAKERPLVSKLYAKAWKYASACGISLLLPYFPLLECLDLGFCELSMEREPAILVALAEHGSHVDSSSSEELALQYKKTLRHINLEGNDSISGEMVSILTKFQPNITILNLSHCTQLDDACIITVSENLRQLHRLNVDGVQWIHDSSIVHVATKHYLWLEGLWVDGCELTDHGIQALTKCSRLRYLSISFCDGLTDISLLAIREIASLTNLTFRKAPQVTQNGFLELFRLGQSRLSNLRTLDVNECPRFDDAAIEAMCNICNESMRFLSLNWCWNVTDAGIHSMVNNLHNLNVLSLVGIHQIYGIPFQDVPEKMPYLCVLNLDHCNRIEDERMLNLARDMPSLWIVNYYGVRFGDDNNLMIDTKHYFEKIPLCDHTVCDSAF